MAVLDSTILKQINITTDMPERNYFARARFKPENLEQ